jgi:hypothetical protein
MPKACVTINPSRPFSQNKRRLIVGHEHAIISKDTVGLGEAVG